MPRDSSEGRPAPRSESAGARRDSVADAARRYIESRPSIRDCLRYDIVNFTALARRIRSETGLASQEAIEIACRRYRRQMAPATADEERLRTVLRASHLQIRTHVAVVTVAGDLEFMERLVTSAERVVAKRTNLVQLFQGPGIVTVLCDDAILSRILTVIPRGSLLRVQHRLSAVTVESPEEVIDTPRVVGFLAEAIGRTGVNCVEIVSVHTQTLFVLRSTDAVRVFELLSELSRSIEAPANGEAPHEEDTGWIAPPPTPSRPRAANTRP
jgi:hypothetical protein